MRRTTGLSLMLLIFLSLCLITFSMMSLTSAVADQKLSGRSSDRTEEYYAAVSTANHTLENIDHCLAELFQNTRQNSQSAAEDFLAACSDLPVQIAGTAWDADQASLTFTIPVKDGQMLEVALTIAYPQKDTDTLYQISGWKIVNIQEWNPDTSQNLYRISE